jgi:subtilisin family serine protease
LSAALERHGLRSSRVLGGRARAGLEPARYLTLTSDHPGFDAAAAVAELRASGAFRAVLPNVRLSLLVMPNDPDLGVQWYVHSLSDDDVQLPQAWDVTHGSPSTIIAILDTGVDTGHPDLAAKIWTNAGEIPGNSLDDDANGYVDDVQGWDFGNDDNDPNPHFIAEPDLGMDVGFHGTFCAGIASAATNNGAGIAGAGWDCSIMALKGADSSGDLTVESAAEGILYAAENGADVLSMSFGAPGDSVGDFFQPLIDDASAAGVVCIAAAGNSDVSTPSYPAANDGVLAVGATDQSGARAFFSNWGPWVDIAAPGSTMWSTICRNYPIDDISQIYYTFLFGWDGETPYMFGDGTSFACPLVAGAVGLVRTRYPQLTPAQVISHVVATGDSVPYDQPIGRKLNVVRAVTTSTVAVDPNRAAGLALAIRPNPSTGSARLELELPRAGIARVEIFDPSGRRVARLLEGALPAGRHRVEWNGRAADGRPVAAGIYVARLESAAGSLERKLVRLSD